MENWFHFYIGSDPRTILWWQMCIRGILIFFWALLMVRIGGKRIFGKFTGFDIVLSVILGSILSRALTGNARFIPTIAAASTITLLHIVLANISFYTKVLGHIIKGNETLLIKDGEILWENMRKANVTEHDLREELRLNASRETFEGIKSAYLERSGSISFIKG